MNRNSQIREVIEKHNSMNVKTHPMPEEKGEPALKQLVIKLSTGQVFISEPVESEIGKVTVDIEVVNYDENVILPKVLPKTWEDLDTLSGYTIRADNSRLDEYINLMVSEHNHNVYATEDQANSALAYAQLTQLMKAYNGDWVPNWNDVFQEKYVIDRFGKSVEPECYLKPYCFLAFPTEELRDEFLKNFEDLIKTFYQI